MKTPWFMHYHNGDNTLVGVYPTPAGVYVRSYTDAVCEVTFYPLGTGFANGAARVVDRIGQYSVPHILDLESRIDDAVEDDLQRRMKSALVSA